MATNPFDLVSTPSPSSGLLSDAISATQQLTGNNTAGQVNQATAATATTPAGKSNAYGYDATKALASTYDPSKMTGNTYDAATANTNNWNVGKNETVQGQLENVLSINNPLMKAAASKANQEMNARGLLNSSMAVKAGQSALYDYALPIASADAATTAAAGKYNADAANQMAQFNTTAKNTEQQFNAGSLNQAGLANQAAENASEQFNAQNETQISLANQSADNQAAATTAAAKQASDQFNAQATNNLQQQSLQNTQQTNLSNQAAYNTALQNDSATAMQAKIANQEKTTQLTMQYLDSAFKTEIANADNQMKLQLQDMQSATQQSLASIEAKYKQIMQANDSAGGLYQQVVKNITDITANPDLDAGSKSTAINQQTNMLKDGLEMFGQLNNLGISALVTF